MDYVINVQFMKWFHKENVYVKRTMSETQHQVNANFHVQMVNSNIKEDVLNVHWIFNTEVKLEDVLVKMENI